MEKPKLIRTFSIFLSTFIIFLLINCSTYETYRDLPVGQEVSMGLRTFSFDQDIHPFDIFSQYRIVPGDILDVLFQVRTWVERENFKLGIDQTVNIKFVHTPELDQTQRVRPDGKIALPYLGDVYVVGKRVEEFTKELQGRYSKILRIPEIYVLVPEFNLAIKELKSDLHTAPRGLSRLVTVRPDGYVTFPMVGDVFVSGKTIPEVNGILNGKYEEVLPDLHCDLFLEKHAGSVIYVVGQVRRAGAYDIPRPITILEALSLAGSWLPGARLDGIIVIRKHEKKMVASRVDLKETLSFNCYNPFFYLLPNDIVYVPRTWVSTTAELAREIGDIIFFRGWSLGWSGHSFDWTH